MFDIQTHAKILHTARTDGAPIEQLSKTNTFTRAEAYRVQEEQLKLREAAGEKVVGWKMGLTSEAKRKQMNLDSPLYGSLTDKMEVRETFSLAGTIHPKIEPEVAFRMARDLKGTPTQQDVIEALSGVAACMEILDSRYTQFKYFSMEDVIADNSSSSHFVMGEFTNSFQNLDKLKMNMLVDGNISQSGVSSDISGHPLNSVIQLCALLKERDQYLKAGQIVLAGAATVAVELKPGILVELRVEGLPHVSVRVV